MNSADGEALLQQAKESGTALAVNFTRRYIPIYQLLKKEMASGLHGKPLHARVTYSKGLFHAGSHAVDLLRFWLGEPVSVHGRPFAHWGPAEDPTFSADILFPGSVAVSLNSFDDRSASVFEIDLFLEKCRFTLQNGGLDWRFYEAGNGEAFSEYREYLPSGRENSEAALRKDDPGALFAAVGNMAEFLDGKAELICPGEEGLKTLRLVEKIRQANSAAKIL